MNIWRTLRTGEWLEDLPAELKQAALGLYGLRLIHSRQLAVLENSVQVSARAAARNGEDLEIFVEVSGYGLAYFDTRCSCAVGRNCRHAYAGLLAGVQLAYLPRADLPQPDPDANAWGVKPLRVAQTVPASPRDGGQGETPGPAVIIPLGVPVPVVRLFREYPFTGYMGWYAGIPFGEEIRLLALEFTYAEAPGEVFAFGTGPVGAEDGSWRRDAVAERACLTKLEALGLQRCGAVMNYALKPHLRDAMVIFPLDNGAWDQLVLEGLSGLAAAGWRIVTEESFDLRILYPEGFYGDLEEKAGKPDWFAADIGIEAGGQRVPLLPLLVSFLKSHPASLDSARLEAMGEKPVLIPMEDGRTRVPVPADRLHRILTSLTELFAGKARLEGSRVSLHRLHAAAFLTGQEFHLAERRTAESLRSLAAHLRGGGAETAPEPPPAGLRAELRPYQLAGYRWLRGLTRHRLGGILADDMGLGKTLQTLAALLAAVESGEARGRPALIVCPTSVLHNWREEALKFTPGLSLHVHHGSARAAALERNRDADLIITSYPLLVRDIAVMEKMEFHLAVLDEAQFIKNPRTQAASCAGRLQAENRLCLTGTPMENHLGELWSIMHFLNPGLLGGWDEFTRLFRTPIEKHQDADRRTRLSRRLAPVFLLRTKQDVLTDLPPRIDLVHRVVLPPAQADLYESVRAAMDRHVREEIARRGSERSRIAVLDALLKLRQVCCHPALLKMDMARKITGGAKLERFMELMTELLEEGRRILVFSQFVEMLKILSEKLDGEKVPHLMLTGQTADRAGMVSRFQAGAVPVFLISLKAGGTGLNLTTADTVIHYDPWWNPAVEAQATDRAHRFGQQHTVFVHKIICAGTVEEKILRLQEKKAALVAGLLGGQSGAENFSSQDIDDLLAPLA